MSVIFLFKTYFGKRLKRGAKKEKSKTHDYNLLLALTISLTISYELPFESKAKHKLYEIFFLFS